MTPAILKRAAVFVLCVNSLSGCAAYFGTKEIEAIAPKSTDSGYIALYIAGRYEPASLAADPTTQIKVSVAEKGALFPGIIALQESGADLKIYHAKPGSYGPPFFVMLGDKRLVYDGDLAGFEVKPRQVTYIGDYDFVFFLHKGILGTSLSGYDLDITNNLSAREEQIRQRVAAVSGNAAESVEISAPTILLEY